MLFDVQPKSNDELLKEKLLRNRYLAMIHNNASSNYKLEQIYLHLKNCCVDKYLRLVLAIAFAHTFAQGYDRRFLTELIKQDFTEDELKALNEIIILD